MDWKKRPGSIFFFQPVWLDYYIYILYWVKSIFLNEFGSVCNAFLSRRVVECVLSSLKISLLKSNGDAKGLNSGGSWFLTLGGMVISQPLRMVSMTKENALGGVSQLSAQLGKACRMRAKRIQFSFSIILIVFPLRANS